MTVDELVHYLPAAREIAACALCHDAVGIVAPQQSVGPRLAFCCFRHGSDHLAPVVTR
jgi:hypothetical protein